MLHQRMISINKHKYKFATIILAIFLDLCFNMIPVTALAAGTEGNKQTSPESSPETILAPIKNPEGSRSGWVVRQKGYQWGGCVWYITDQQIKMSGSFLSMIINRKTKKITLFSLKSNRYRTYPLAECAKRVGIYRAKQHYVFGAVKAVGKTQYLGQPALELVRIGQRVTDERTRRDVEFRDDVVASSKIQFEPEINKVLESVLYSVYSHGLPFKMVRSGYIKGRERRSTQTLTLTEVYFVKARPIPDSEFALPKGLKPSRSEMDLLSSDMDADHI